MTSQTLYVVAITGALLTQGVLADADGTLPPLAKLRFDEDYSDMRNHPAATGWPERVKYIPFGKSGPSYVTLGGEIRQRYEYTNNPTFGQSPQDAHGVWFQRYSILADVHWSPRFRLFAQLNSALETGRAEGPSPVDENELAWQNLFLDIGFASADARVLTLRPGRQEIVLGSGRLVDVREGPNVRRTFDGVRGFSLCDQFRLDLLATRPRTDEPGVFDDETSDRYALWGVYATKARPLDTAGNLDLYYLGYEDKNALYVQGSGREHRHSIGLRYWGEQNDWSWNWETLYQFGHFARDDIHAWTLATETAYRWQQHPWKPQLRFSVNIASGDKNPDDGTLGTFNPLFPRGNYFSEAAVLGPRNFYNFHTFVNILPTADWSLTADLNFFWRLQTEDGLYSPSGQIIRAPMGSDSHFATTALSLTAEYTFFRGLVFTAIYTFGNPEAFFRDTGPADDLSFTELTLQYRF